MLSFYLVPGKMGQVASFLWLSNVSLMQLCLAGHFCRENTLKSQNGFPINIDDRNVGWKGSLEGIQSDLFLDLSLEVVQSSLIARCLPLLNQVIHVFTSGP